MQNSNHGWDHEVLFNRMSREEKELLLALVLEKIDLVALLEEAIKGSEEAKNLAYQMEGPERELALDIAVSSLREKKALHKKMTNVIGNKTEVLDVEWGLMYGGERVKAVFKNKKLSLKAKAIYYLAVHERIPMDKLAREINRHATDTEFTIHEGLNELIHAGYLPLPGVEEVVLDGPQIPFTPDATTHLEYWDKLRPKLMEKNLNQAQVSFAFHFSALMGDTEMMENLIRVHRIDVNQLDQNGISAIFKAAFNNHTETVVSLLNHGADSGHIEYDLSLIETCILNGNEQLVKLLLNQGIDLTDPRYLILAVSHGHMNIIDLLIEKGADVNAAIFNKTPLTFARFKKNEDIINLLKAYGAKEVTAGKKEQSL